MKKLMFLGCLFFGLTLSACSDATKAQIGAIGNPAEITCFSGGDTIYHGFSTGKIATEAQSDGWYFNERGSNRLIRVSGDCLVRN
jgi:hypothetical protein